MSKADYIMSENLQDLKYFNCESISVEELNACGRKVRKFKSKNEL